MNNTEFAEKDQEFRFACEKAQLPPTKRQASKYRLKSGRAYKFRNGNSAALDEHKDFAINLSQE